MKRIAERVFDPDVVYSEAAQLTAPLEKAMRQLYGVYIYLRDHDMSEESNTSRLLQEHSPAYLTARLADELEELAEVQTGKHVHSDRQSDTILEGSQVGYWLLLLASTNKLQYAEFQPHTAILQGYAEHVSAEQSIELRAALPQPAHHLRSALRRPGTGDWISTDRLGLRRSAHQPARSRRI